MSKLETMRRAVEITDNIEKFVTNVYWHGSSDCAKLVIECLRQKQQHVYYSYITECANQQRAILEACIKFFEALVAAKPPSDDMVCYDPVETTLTKMFVKQGYTQPTAEELARWGRAAIGSPESVMDVVLEEPPHHDDDDE